MKPDTDNYLCMKRIKQLYMELYKTENIEKFKIGRASCRERV